MSTLHAAGCAIKAAPSLHMKKLQHTKRSLNKHMRFIISVLSEREETRLMQIQLMLYITKWIVGFMYEPLKLTKALK